MAKKIIIIPELDEGKLRQQLRKIGKRKERITVDIDSGVRVGRNRPHRAA